MALPTSPSVVVLENDRSVYTPNVDSSVVGVVGFADKGPVDKATLITNQSNLLRVFGKPTSEIPGQGIEGALEILEATNQIYFVRAANDNAKNASAVVALGFSPSVQVSANPAHSTFSSFTFRYSIKDKAGDFVASNTVTLTSSMGATVNAAFLKYFNKDVVSDNPIYAMADSGGSLFLTTRYAGAGARLEVSGSGNTIGFCLVDADGDAAGAVVNSNIIASGGTADTTGAGGLYALFETINPGAGYNLSSLRDGSIVGVSVEVENKSIRDSIVFNFDGATYESFLTEMSPSSQYSLTYVLNTEDGINQSELANATINSNSVAFTLPNNFADSIGTAKNFSYGTATAASKTPRFVKLVESTIAFNGGESGYTAGSEGNTGTKSDTDTIALIGEAGAKTGMYALDDDGLNISLALVPGITSQAVQNELITLAETSKNFVAIVSPPYGLEAQDAIDWINGRNIRTSPINSSYAAVYWPWVQTFNYYAGGDEWYDPAIFAARQYVYTDSVSEPWFAPAGYRRGRLTKPTDVEIVLSQGDKDALYSNNINPLTKEPQGGIAIFGQKTAQRLPTALDRVNVRRLMIYIRKILLQLGKPFQFEPNDTFTWQQVESSLDPFVNELLAKRAITDGTVICDETTNTPLRVDRNELWCTVVIRPTKAAETIVFEVNLTNQSATVNG